MGVDVADGASIAFAVAAGLAVLLGLAVGLGEAVSASMGLGLGLEASAGPSVASACSVAAGPAVGSGAGGLQAPRTSAAKITTPTSSEIRTLITVFSHLVKGYAPGNILEFGRAVSPMGVQSAYKRDAKWVSPGLGSSASM